MIGLTNEITSVTGMLEELYRQSVTTYGCAPTHFVLGPAERARLAQEVCSKKSTYGGIPIVAGTRDGVDVGVPEPLAG